MKDKIDWWNLDLGEESIAKLNESYAQKKLSYGGVSHQLEQKLAAFLSVPSVMLTTSGSVALLIAMKTLGIGPGDEVIVPNRTFQATANAAYFVGAKIKLADVSRETGLIDLDSLESLISEKTKAIIVVHLNGRCVDVDLLKKKIHGKNIYIVEDVAQAFGSKINGNYAGTMGDIGCFSMGVTKFLTTGQGGFLTTKNPDFYSKMKNYLFHSQDGSDDKTFNNPGFNFRFSDLLASLALGQVEKYVEKKKKYFDTYAAYEKKLAGSKKINLIKSNNLAFEIPIWVEITTPNRDEIFDKLKNENIESVKFYPSLNKAPFLKIGNEGQFENSDFFEKHGLILPCGPDISTNSIERVLTVLEEWY